MKLRSDLIAAFLSFLMFLTSFIGTLQDYSFKGEIELEEQQEEFVQAPSSSGGGGGGGGARKDDSGSREEDDDGVTDDVYGKEPDKPKIPERLNVTEYVYYSVNDNHDPITGQFKIYVYAPELVNHEESFYNIDYRIKDLKMDGRKYVAPTRDSPYSASFQLIYPLKPSDSYYIHYGWEQGEHGIYFITWHLDERAFTLTSTVNTNELIWNNLPINETLTFTIYHPEHEHLTAEVEIDIVFTSENRD